MSHRLLILLAVGVCVLAASPLHAQGKKSNGGATTSGWVSNFAEAKRQAANSGKPMMIVIRCVP